METFTLQRPKLLVCTTFTRPLVHCPALGAFYMCRQNRVSRTSAGILFVRLRGEFAVKHIWWNFAYPLFISGYVARKGPIFVARHFLQQSSWVQNQNFTRIFALQEFFPEHVASRLQREYHLQLRKDQRLAQAEDIQNQIGSSSTILTSTIWAATEWGTLNKSWFSGRAWRQQLFNFQSPAVQWMAQTSSLNCLSCRDPYQAPGSLNCLPPFHWKPLFSLKSASSHPLPKNQLWLKGVYSFPTLHAKIVRALETVVICYRRSFLTLCTVFLQRARFSRIVPSTELRDREGTGAICFFFGITKSDFWAFWRISEPESVVFC